MCLDPWNEHSYRTGGYFSCNRYNAQRRASSRVNEARSSMVRNVQVFMKLDHVWLCRLSNIVKLLLKMLRDN